MYIGRYVKYPLFLSDFNINWVFVADLKKKHLWVSNFMKIRPVGAELFVAGGRTDGQTDMIKLTAAFRNFAKAPRSFS